MFGSSKFGGKVWRKKIERKSEEKLKIKQNKKQNRFKVNKLFFMLFQTYFTYFNFS